MKEDGSTSDESRGITTSVFISPAPSLPSRGSSSAEEDLHCQQDGERILASTPSAQSPLPHRVPTLSAQLPRSSHHDGSLIDVMAMVRNRGSGSAPRSAVVVDRPDGERKSADVHEQQERQPMLGVGARYTLGAKARESSSSSSSSSRSGVPIPVAFDVMTMVRNRGRESPPPPPPPQRSASVEDRPSGEPLTRGPTDANGRQKLQTVSDVDAGTCDTSGVPCGGSGSASIDSANQSPTSVGGSTRGCTRGPDERAATAADRGLQGGRGTLSDQSPSFDAMAMVRDRGSERAPPPPPSPRSTSTGDRPRGEPLAREPADVHERPELQPPLVVDAGACDTSKVSVGGNGNASIDSAVLAPTGVGGSSRGCTQDRGAATAADSGLPGGRAAVSDQSPIFDVMAMVRNHGSEPTPPALVVDRSQGATSTCPGFVGSGPLDTAGLGLYKNCYFCGRQSKRVRMGFKELWVCGKKCGRWACGATKCFSDVANCCSCDGDAAAGCRCFNCERKRKRKKAHVNHNGGLIESRPANKVARRTASWNSFVLPATLADGGDSTTASVYSVCGTRRGNRVLVVTNGEHTMCFWDECKGVGTAAASANEQGGRSSMEACEHGEAAEKTRAQQPTSVRFHAEADLRALAMDLADKGVVGDHEVGRIQEMYRAACASGVPLVAKLGDTGYYVVRDGGVDDDARSFPAGWAHVLYDRDDREGGAGGAARDGRKTDDGEVVCKAFNGGGCFQAESGRKVCVHTHIVRIAALTLKGPGYREAATGAGTMTLTNLDGVDGAHRDDDIFASAHREFESNSPSFARKMSQLVKISAVYLIPPNPLEHLPRDGPLLAERFTCFEKTCTLCGVRYEEMADQPAVAVTQGWTGVMMRRVSVEMRECSTCGAQAWASDNWRTTGMFNFNNKLLVDIRILVGAREFYTRGLPLEGIFEQILAELKRNIGWLEKNPELTLRLTNTDLGQQLKDCYFAFEATTDHPGDHSSILDGHFPRLQACDGSNKLVTDNVHMDMLLQARQEKVIDMDLGAQQLKFSMMTPMVFGTRFQFVTKAPVNFTPANRKSNVFRLSAREATPLPGSVESGDGAQLLEYLRKTDRGMQALDDMAKTELDNLYIRSFGGRSGLDRYSTKALLVELFQKLRARFVGLTGGSEECSEFLLGRGSAATSGVEGFFTSDGVQVAHMFLWRARGPKFVVDMVNHFLVPPIVLVTDTPCTVRPIMEQRCGHLLENGGLLPGGGPSGEDSTADSEGAATGLDNMPKPPPVEVRDVSISTLAKLCVSTIPIAGSGPMVEDIELQIDVGETDPQQHVGEIDLQQHDAAAVADVYELFRRASASSPAQLGLDFFCLLDTAARESPDDCAVGLCNAVVDSWNEMHERGYYFLSLYEAALVEMECCRLTAAKLKALWHTSTGSGGGGRGGGKPNGVEERQTIADLSTGTSGVGRGRGSKGERGTGGGGGEEERGGDVLHWRHAEKREQFLRKVLSTAVGATKLSGAPILPGFSVRALVPNEPAGSIGGLDALLKYGEAKVNFIADGLKPDDDRLKEKAVHFLRGGAGFGTPVHAVKCLQIALSGCNPGESASEEGLVKGYGLPFNIKPPEPGQERKPHPIVGKVAGLHLSAGGPQEAKKHGPKCRARFGGLETCEELAGVNRNPHERNQVKKKWCLPSLNVMSCDAFAFMVTLGNELENQSINRRSLDRLVEKHPNHPKEHEVACQVLMWNCGRCFCSRPLMRCFDRFGRVSVTFLDKELVL